MYARTILIFTLWLAGCASEAPPEVTAPEEPVRGALADDTVPPSGPFVPLEAQVAHNPEGGARDRKVRVVQPAVPVAAPAENPRLLARQHRYLDAWREQLAAHPEWSAEEHEKARATLKSATLDSEVTP